MRNLNNYHWHEFLNLIIPLSNRVHLSSYVSFNPVNECEAKRVQEIQRSSLLKSLDELQNVESHPNLWRWYKDSPEALEQDIQFLMDELNELNDSCMSVVKDFSIHDVFKETVFEDALIDHRIEQNNYVSENPVFRNCVFNLDESVIADLYSMDNPYESIDIKGCVFEDPAFFMNDTCIAAICSHEGYTNFMLEDDVVLAHLAPDGHDDNPVEFVTFSLPDDMMELLVEKSFSQTWSDQEQLEFVLEHGTICEDGSGSIAIHIDDYNALNKSEK
ncbi:hypothetical protein AOC36_02080 [Erysipelothrix larvae]|uniref:Uncharacterized protein n=1 Tax=Erysipelothrix larvae TaxID=1514105 RepID=A0A0X8GYL0_9FIRM|nr:hypothetical protein [Erysipelothrix larvae]AMC92814.1 hypothetical protein AOC36_02080 [Erysipelothrix larvae]